MKKIVVSLSTSSFVSWLQVWKQMHSWLSLPISTSWRWKETQREFEKKKVLKDQLPFWKKEKNVKGCVSQKSDPMSSTLHGKLKNWDWTLRRDTPEILRMHLVQNWIRESRRRSGGIIQKGEPHERNPCAPSLRRNTWGNLTTSRLYLQSSVEFGGKICKLKVKDNYVLFSCEGARDTEDRMFIVSSGVSMHNAERGDLSSDTMDTPRRSKNTMCDSYSANKRVSTSFCSWSQSVRNSAHTR